MMACGEINNKVSCIIRDPDDSSVYMRSDRHFGASILRKMYENDKLCDVSLYGMPPVGTGQSSLRPIRAYKAVLAQASRHLLDLFTVDGYIDSHQSEYTIETVDHDILRRIVEYGHTDDLKFDSRNAVEDVRNILVGADYLLMQDLVDACETFLAYNSEVKNDAKECIKMWLFARKHCLLTLLSETVRLVARQHMGNLPNYDVFLSLPYDDLAKLLMSEAFIRYSWRSGQRYQAAMAWLSFDDTRPKKYAYDVLNMVPFASGELPTQTMWEASENKMLIEHVPELLRLALVNTSKRQALAKAAAERGELFCVFVKTMCGENIPVKACKDSTTIEELKSMFQDIRGIPLDDQRLIFDAKQLEDAHTLAFYGIRRNSVMHLVLRLKGCVCDCMAHKADEMWAKSGHHDKENSNASNKDAPE